MTCKQTLLVGGRSNARYTVVEQYLQISSGWIAVYYYLAQRGSGIPVLLTYALYVGIGILCVQCGYGRIVPDLT